MRTVVLGMCAAVAVSCLTGCATSSVFHKNAEGGADVVFEYQGFAKSALGNKPYVNNIDGKLVAMGVTRSNFKLTPGPHKVRVLHKQMGMQFKGDAEFTIPGTGKYKVVITRGETTSKLTGKFAATAKVVPVQ